MEEIGIKIKVNRLLFVETVNHFEMQEDNVFYFDGGILNKSLMHKISLTEGEIINFGFYNNSDAKKILEL
ncbi:MAG: hypothetical protein ACJA2Z_000442 [Candidatus Paceibacteria bacterium]|jgi:hypothetical protein